MFQTARLTSLAWLLALPVACASESSEADRSALAGSSSAGPVVPPSNSTPPAVPAPDHPNDVEPSAQTEPEAPADTSQPTSETPEGTPPTGGGGGSGGDAPIGTGAGMGGALAMGTGGERTRDAGASSKSGRDGGPADVAPATEPGCTSFEVTVAVAELEESSLTQLSGMVASRKQPGVFYAHLDAGAEPNLFVFDALGSDLGRVVLSGLETRDWEDVTATPMLEDGRALLFIGDIGDNAARTGGTPRSDLSILRLVEPEAPRSGESVDIADWERIPVAYPDESHDAETLMYDVLTNELIVVTKEDSGPSSVFRLPADAPADELVTLELLGEVVIGDSGGAAQASAGDISPNGDRILVRNYENALLWPRASGQSVGEALLAEPIVLGTVTEPQSEGVTWSADGTSWFSAGEQALTLYEARPSCE
jgi:hypothetical protein